MLDSAFLESFMNYDVYSVFGDTVMFIQITWSDMHCFGFWVMFDHEAE